MIMSIVAVGAALFMVGCDKKLPTPERMNAIATAVGKTAGYVCELSKTKTEVKEAIANVLDIASKVTPDPDQTFVDAWMPIVDEEIAKLVEAGKLDKAGAAVARVALNVACEGLDYVFTKYPKAKEVQELVSIAVSGFVDGYKSVVNFAANETIDLDKDAYDYLKAKLANK